MHHEMVPPVFCHTTSLVCEGLWSTGHPALNELYIWVKLLVSLHSILISVFALNSVNSFKSIWFIYLGSKTFASRKQMLFVFWDSALYFTGMKKFLFNITISVCSYHVTYTSRVNLHTVIILMPRKSLLKVGVISEIYLIFEGTLSSLRRFLATKIPLKMMKNAFLFHLKSYSCSSDN